MFKRLSSKPLSLKDALNETTKHKKKFYFKSDLAQTKAIFEVTGRSYKFPLICAVSLLLFASGAAIAIMMGNWFLVPVLAIGLMFVPF